jgi:hypothetical protein
LRPREEDRGCYVDQEPHREGTLKAEQQRKDGGRESADDGEDPVMAHPQATVPGGNRSASPIPRGNGIPRKNPSGNTSAPATAIRIATD